MAIEILPARLANQIAAGEVVERPASVVKELVENSLDSGATRIEIDIEKGGSKLIRVRDNGQGIPKDELTLALSRHATSKIHTLDDLEAIMSLGFRGEALASISSVSRLSLTSRPVTQEEAWLAYSEGREMDVKLQPAAHPVGTTVEVLDLFFNTPARRKFLRTEKTEFTHIDELLKRIALSRFDTAITLKHNGKVVRQYRAGISELQKEKRLAAVCGTHFVKSMLKIELEHDDLKLYGWITSPDGARQQNDLQYCYVNGRMMKDKLINHAIRQSYEGSLSSDQYAAFVLFIEVDPHQVDVNVHPAKHEVRFHQARLVHDFIYQALASALAESQYIDVPMVSESAFHYDVDSHAEAKRESSVTRAQDVPLYPGQKGYKIRSENAYEDGEPARSRNYSVDKGNSQSKYRSESPSKREVEAYTQLIATNRESDDFNLKEPRSEWRGANISSASTNVTISLKSSSDAEPFPLSLGKAVSIVEGRYTLMQESHRYFLLSLERVSQLRLRKQLDSDQPLKSQPLLVPLTIKLGKEKVSSLSLWDPIFIHLGIDLKYRKPDGVMVMGVPQPLRQQNLQKVIADLLSYAFQYLDPNSAHSRVTLANWLADYLYQINKHEKQIYTLSEAIQLISELENLWQGKVPLDDEKLVRPVDFSPIIEALS
ncbi:DNA mismatch repair endonuclease MutL [Vibrio viridaestus]|uniref:DNA mismatch repair protein MutL n=1 Tax=Vibrio viridaestus TaxID=2487322 RepID=A0A3N9TAJ6_9VIBR|nr:DNA mismatch repair endonuclease MutL [Vibrio viridaestus]RQW61141.1 DNA mismatch repair endonuclease MutL [Vibrio viridaestus]